MRQVRYALLTTLAMLIIAGIGNRVAARDDQDGDSEHEAYAIGLWGDLPYSAIQATVGVPNLIADMNSQRLAFTVHDGDLKTGNGSPICNDQLY